MENLERSIIMMEAAIVAIEGHKIEAALAYIEDASAAVKDELFNMEAREEEREKCLLTI